MSIEFLKSKKAPFPLEIREVDLLKIIPELKRELEISEQFFEIDRTKKQLETKEILIPIFENNRLFPIQYDEIRNGKVKESYPSYSNFIGYKIAYRKGNLLKIVHNKGVKVLKQSDEKFLSEIIDITKDYHFQFNFTENRWKYMEDVSMFEKLKEELETNIKSKAVISLIDEFFDLLDTYHTKLLKINALDTASVSEEIEKILNTVETYLEFQNIVGALTNKNLDVIKNRINELNTASLEAKKSIGIVAKSKSKDTYSTIIGKVHKLLSIEGYWIIENQIYPNVAAFHASTQKSSYNRTPDYKRNLKRALIAWATKFEAQKKNYVEDIHSPSFVRYIKETSQN